MERPPGPSDHAGPGGAPERCWVVHAGTDRHPLAADVEARGPRDAAADLLAIGRA